MYERIFKFYRVEDWIKSLGYSFLGLNVYESLFITNPLLFFVGMVQSFFLFSFLFSLNDFGDHIVCKEKNFIGNLIQKFILSKNLALLLCLIPLFLSIIPLVINFSINYFIFYLLFVIISFFYSLPGIRFRDIAVVEIICCISFYSLIFLQSIFFVNTKITLVSYFLLSWVILYTFSQEINHQIYHLQKDKKSGRTTMMMLIGNNKLLFLRISFLISVLFGFIIYIFFSTLRIFTAIMIFFGLIRFLYVYKFNEKSNFKRLKDKLGGIIEGVLYFLLIFLKI